MAKRLRALLCRIFGHGWETTHTNRWMVPTRQECGCGASRDWHGFLDGEWVDNG